MLAARQAVAADGGVLRRRSVVVAIVMGGIVRVRDFVFALDDDRLGAAVLKLVPTGIHGGIATARRAARLLFLRAKPSGPGLSPMDAVRNPVQQLMRM